ncbi:amino acid adenylation domain-containing protein [Chitinophaga sp. Mgbs1]|uniref:Amino acid adenylation domain-containing protein n=1 Tax=Chitinophaga solisilvae TaxID=1233460 RepID=A0A433WQ17_9BACT|nr:amino acid adenylation domain-containing protein [Chitinophaga solisilvae]
MLEDVYPLSPLQKGLYYHWLNDPGSQAYFSQISCTVKGNLQLPLLEESYRQLTARHAILRAFFTHTVGEEPLQVIRSNQPPVFAYADVSHDPALSLLDYRAADREKGFNLQTGAQIRLTVLKTGADQHEFIWSHHHILMDGWCLRILMKEFTELYTGLLRQRPAQLGRVYPYANYIKWLSRQDKAASLDYWRAYLSAFSQPTGIPATGLPDKGRMAGRKSQLRIEGTLRQGIRQLCHQLQVTENIFFQAVWSILLGWYNNTTDVLFGAVVSGRPPQLEGVEQMIGLFINTIPVRVNLSDAPSFTALMKALQLDFIRGTAHHHVELAEIQAAAQTGRALFDHIIVFENYPDQEPAQPSDAAATAPTDTVAFTALEAFEQTSYDCWMSVIPGAALTVKIHYNTLLYKEEQITQLLEHLQRLMTAVVEQPDIAPEKTEILSPEEKLQLLFTFNDTQAAFSDHTTLTALFETQVRSAPETTALVYEDTSLSFGALNTAANRLAHCLLQQYNIRREEVVGIRLQRSPDMIIAILGILKAGGAYLPLDPSYPQSRVDYIVNNSNCRLVIDDTWLDGYRVDTTVYPEHNPDAGGTAADLLYVIYTSGSTGNPKGCMIEHRGVINRLEWMWRKYHFSAEEVILQKTNFTFDVSVPEIFMPLCLGAKMVLCPADDVASPPRLAALIARHAVTCVHFVPSMLNEFIPFLTDNTLHRQLASVRHVMVSGEALSPQTAARWYEQMTAPLHNLYGPTEASIEVTCYDVAPGDATVLIGKPIANTGIYILDQWNRLMPAGVPGEICIGGVGLARGYMNAPELTAQKFVPHPCQAGQRIYRTGDAGRWLPGGQVEYLGRKDDQVKIRGFRIEPDEISRILEEHPEIISAVVTVYQSEHNNDKALVAYMIATAQLDTAAVKSFLSTRLPEYMIPAWYIQLDKFPLTTSGKTDRKRLPPPDMAGLGAHGRYVMPGTRTEEQLAAIWQAVLGIERIGIKDHFFSRGGHSIKAIQLLAQIQKVCKVKLALKDLFTHPVLEDQARLIAQADSNSFTAITPLPQQESYILSSSQLRIWILSQFENAGAAYVMQGRHSFGGDMDTDVLNAAFHTLIARHEILRTVFRQNDAGEVRQFVLDPAAIHFAVDIHDLRAGISDDAAAIILQRYAKEPFDLTTGPLLRILLFRNNSRQWTLHYFMHHIIGDEWSIGILIKELLHTYQAMLENIPATPAPLRIHYKDYAAWEQEQLHADKLQAHRTWWLQQFEGELPVLNMPQDRVRPPVKSYQGGVVHSSLPADTLRKIRQLNEEAGATLFMSLLAFVNIFLHRYSGQEDVVVGTVITGRDHADLEDQIGCYLKTLALRTGFSGGDTYWDLLLKARKLSLGAYEHYMYPFEDLVEELHLPRDMSRHPLIDVMLILHGKEGVAAADAAPHESMATSTSKFDLLFEFSEAADALHLTIGYNSDIYNGDTVARMAAHCCSLITEAVSRPELPVNQLAYLSAEEKHTLLHVFNDNAVEYPSDSTFVDLFLQQATRTPLAAAVKAGEEVVTYRDLHVRAARLAAHLQLSGIGEGALVPVCLERSADMIITVLGILMAGAAYVPIDPGYPPERIQYILTDCDAQMIVCSESTAQLLPAGKEIQQLIPGRETATDTYVTAHVQPAHLAYVIYTSGSTGTPKGVMVEHAGMLNHLFAKINDLHITDQSVIAYTASFTFDISVWQMLAALLKGGHTIVFPDELIYQPAALIQAVDASNTTILELVPSYLAVALDTVTEIAPKHLKILLTTGEAVSRKLLEKWFGQPGAAHIPVMNAYGPTEASDDICHHLMYNVPEQVNVPVGKPIQNTRIYVLNAASELCPVGVSGEICVTGIGVSRGYLHQPELTAAKFVEDPFGDGTWKMYRTGDLGRWLPDGTIEYAGRLDEQVKIHGYRIEPGEIEHVIKGCPLVREAAVLVADAGNGSRRLAGYIVPEGPFSKEGIIQYLKGKLPDYMIPAQLLPLEQLPLTINGKLDKKTLLQITGTIEDDIEIIAPRTPLEEQLAVIWQEVLGKEKVSVTRNFFEDGGQSLRAIQLIARINAAFQVKITVQTIFRDATIESIAGQIDFLQEQQRKKHAKEGLIQIEL